MNGRLVAVVSNLRVSWSFLLPRGVWGFRVLTTNESSRNFSPVKAWTERKATGRSQKRMELLQTVPEELETLSVMTDQSFELLDYIELSATAFQFVAQRIKNRERETWNL